MIDGQGTLSHYGAMNNSRATTRKLSADDQECSRFSKTEVVALLAICLTHIGDAIEVYLPSILTQNISCEMGLSDTHHGILSVAFYCFCAAGLFIPLTVSNMYASNFDQVCATSRAPKPGQLTMFLHGTGCSARLVARTWSKFSVYMFDVVTLEFHSWIVSRLLSYLMSFVFSF